jgi:putative Ca2+/H+ antiporter (TMEM165/GDT1 family)
VRQWKLIPDERIPGTLNVGYVIPTVIQAYIYTRLVPVDSTTLILMIVAAVLGAWLGAGVVSQWNRRKVQIGMGLALLGFAIIMIIRQTGEAPTGGAVLSLTGAKLAIGVAGNFVLGALMTLGIGLYAPCLILVGLLGMTETTAFPIMMGSCAFLMPFANVRFMRSNAYHAPSIMSMLLAGIPAVLIAAFLVTNLPLTVLKWLVVVVVIYTGTNMLRTARRERDLARDATAAEAQPAV